MRLLRRATLLLLPVLAAAAVSAPCWSQAAPPKTSRQDRLAGLDAYIESAMRAWQVPGLSIAVVKDDKVVYAKGFGVRKVGEDGGVDADTVFAIASNSKAFTCTALAMLKDEGKLNWDDRVSEILPWFQLHDGYATRDLRVLDLLVHRSGLPTFGGDHLWIGSKFQTREILERIRYQKLTAPFRSSFQYQNIMYTAAGEVIRAESGKSWAEFVKARILAPLGMDHTSTSISQLATGGNVAIPHELRGPDEGLVTMPFDNVDAVAAAAALNSSANDVARWLRFNLAGGEIDGKRLISPRAMAELVQSHTPIPTSPGYARFFHVHLRSYGLGWFLNDYKGRKIISHGGGLTGMISRTVWVPEEQLGVVVLTNMAENSLPTAVTNRVLDRYFGEPDRDWSADLLNIQGQRQRNQKAAADRLTKARIPDTSPSLPLASYAGTYNNPLPGDATVSVEDGKLYFFYNERHRGYLTHWHYDTFRIVWINHIMDMDKEAFMRFELDDAARVKRLHTTWYHPIRFERTK